MINRHRFFTMCLFLYCFGSILIPQIPRMGFIDQNWQSNAFYVQSQWFVSWRMKRRKLSNTKKTMISEILEKVRICSKSRLKQIKKRINLGRGLPETLGYQRWIPDKDLVYMDQIGFIYWRPSSSLLLKRRTGDKQITQRIHLKFF